LLNHKSSINPLYFSTRDLLIMAVLGAMGGVASTYVNILGDAVQAALGIPGATQWAAGLHVIWIVLGMGILRKPGTGIGVGILKGAVELMSGNSHGIIILLVDLVAGLLVDFVFLLFRKKQSLLPYMLGGSLASASNVLVFQLFATIPSNILGLTAIGILFLVALVSGLIFAGILPFLLVKSLSNAGVVKAPEFPLKKQRVGWWILLCVFILAASLAIFLRVSLQGPKSIDISGAVDHPYQFPGGEIPVELVTRQMAYSDVMTEYSGYLLSDLIEYAEPRSNADTLLIEASEGYAFFISFEELKNNPNILLVTNGQGTDASLDIVGPKSSKAWVRNVSKITVIASEGLNIILPSGEITQFDPDEWVTEMDSTQVALPQGSTKLQGVAAWKIVEAYDQGKQAENIVFRSTTEEMTFAWSEIQDQDDLRIFTVIEQEGISFALAEMSGDVQMYPLTELEIE